MLFTHWRYLRALFALLELCSQGIFFALIGGHRVDGAAGRCRADPGAVMAGWRVHTDIGADRTVHVWPEDPDAITHDLDGPCICGPLLEEQTNGNVLVVHHSLDGRELTER